MRYHPGHCEPESITDSLKSRKYLCLTVENENRVFANSLRGRRSILGRVIPKTLKMVLDAAFLNTQHYKELIEVKVEQSRERNSGLPYTSVY